MLKIFCNGISLDTSQDESVKLNFSIQSYQDFAAKRATFSYSFLLPATENNELVFKNYGDFLNYSDFNPYELQNVDIEVDGYTIIFGGTLRVLGVTYVPSKAYRVNIQGGECAFIDQFGKDMISDLDISSLNHQFTRQNILTSWQSGSTTAAWQSGYTYPLAEYGNYPEFIISSWMKLKTLYPEHFYPALFQRYILEKMFTGKTYTFTSDSFFNEDRFTQVVIPFSNDVDDWLDLSGYTAKLTSTSTSWYPPTSNMWGTVFSASNTTYDYYDQIANSTGAGKLSGSFIAGLSGNYRFLYTVGNVSKGVNTDEFSIRLRKYIPENVDTNYSLAQWKDEVPLIIDDNDGNSCIHFLASGGTNYGNQTWYWDVYLEKDERVYTAYYSDYNEASNATGLTCTILDMSNRREGAMVNANKLLPQNLSQKEFIQDILSTYNLFFYQPTGNTSNQLKFLPRDEYYAGSTVIDWTDKLLKNFEYGMEPLSITTQSRFIFKSKDDRDTESENYKSSYNKGYDEVNILVDKNLTGEQKFESLFSSSVLKKATGYSKMFLTALYDTDTETNKRKKRSVGLKRLYYKWRDITPEFWLWQSTSTSPTTVTKYGYPYMGYLYDPTSSGSTNHSTHFGDPDNYAVKGTVGGKNIYNEYHRKYIDNLKHKHCHIFTGIFRLTPQDISQLISVDKPLSQEILIQGNSYNIDSIEGWNPQDHTAKVKLIRNVIGYTDIVPDGVNGNGGILSGYSYEIDASEEYSTNYGWKAFDKNTSTYWGVFNTSWTSGGQLSILSWVFKDDFKIQQYEILSEVGYQPTSFSLWAYDGVNFIQLHTVTDNSWSGASQIFQCSNQGYYKYYMLMVTKANNVMMKLNNLYLYERIK